MCNIHNIHSCKVNNSIERKAKLLASCSVLSEPAFTLVMAGQQRGSRAGCDAGVKAAWHTMTDGNPGAWAAPGYGELKEMYLPWLKRNGIIVPVA